MRSYDKQPRVEGNVPQGVIKQQQKISKLLSKESVCLTAELRLTGSGAED